jgi:hypothetical protein
LCWITLKKRPSIELNASSIGTPNRIYTNFG